MPAKNGTKTYEETLQIKQRYADLSDDHFKFLKRMQKSKKIEDNKFAAQELSKAFIKMIPQTISGDPENPLEHNFKLDDSAKQTIRDAIRGITGEIKQE